MDISWYEKHVSQYPRLDRDQEKLLGSQMKDDSEAKDQFIKSNLYLVVKIAKGYSRNGNLPDLIQEGNIGLMRAVEKYDPAMENRFSTYGQWWIKQSITRYLQSDKMKMLPPHRTEMIRKIMRYAEDYYSSNGKEPSDKHLAEQSSAYLGKRFNIDEIRDIKSQIYSSSSISIDETLTEGSDTARIDLMGESDEDDTLSNLAAKSIADIIKVTISSMDISEDEKTLLDGMMVHGNKLYEQADIMGSNWKTASQRYFKLKRQFLSELKKTHHYDELKGMSKNR